MGRYKESSIFRGGTTYLGVADAWFLALVVLRGAAAAAALVRTIFVLISVLFELRICKDLVMGKRKKFKSHEL